MNTPNQRKGFTFYRSFAEAIELLPDAEQLVAYKIIMAYSLDGIEPKVEELPLFVKMLWTAFKPNLDADRRRYENGTKGGCPKGAAKPSMIGNQNAKKQNKTETKPNQNQNETETKPNQNQNKSNVNVNANVNVNEKENVNENVEGEVALPPMGVKFTPPSLMDIRDYIHKMGYEDIDAQRFADYYASVGWRVGGSPMQDWKAALRRWHSQPKPLQTNNLKTKTNEPKHTTPSTQCAPRLFRNLADDDYLCDAPATIPKALAHNSRASREITN